MPVAIEDLKSQLSELAQKIQHYQVRLDVAGKRREVERLEALTNEPDFWSDPQHAQGVLRRLNQLRSVIETWSRLGSQIDDLVTLQEMGEAEGDESTLDEVQRDYDELRERFSELEFQLALSGEYDASGAILSIHASEGGTESQDWAQMLLRMYLRWAEKRGYKSEILDLTPGEEAGIKSATIQIDGEYAYGYLKGERGGHRLVRISPFDSAKRRHTSFALVEAMPLVEHDLNVEINPDDVEMDVFRSSGAGGQHVNKTSSAVRLTHKPSGIVVTCQNERSQAQNREVAMRILRARLLERRLAEVEAEQRRLKGEHVGAGFGNSIRSYVLHPYNLVKDSRTGHETSNTQAVLDGALDDFMRAWLHSQIGAA
ncbi:MAG: peptide chain release factor 2 [Chloroflexi bacterium]|nr:peptide chain release factor 2 [Chloroflexota bacterium]